MSQSVDERVVKMEFDNKEFEKNASTSMSTLEKLKESLKFDKVKDSFKEITKAAGKVDLSHVDESVQTVKSSFSAMQIVGYTAISNLTTRMMGFANNVVGGVFRQAVQGGINRSFNIEKAKFTIEGLGKSFKKLEEDINYAVSGTAYGFDEAAVAASSMAASGIKSGEEMKTALRGISGMAAMTGSSYSEMADIFTTVAGNSRLLTQQLNQFSARGMNAAATLRDYINKNEELRKSLIAAGLKSTNAKQIKEFANATKLTEKNVRALVSGSVIDFKTFSKAMDEAFGEHAKAANKTFNGVMSNIKATLSRIGEAFIHPLIANNDMDNAMAFLNNRINKATRKTEKIRANTQQERKKLFKDLRKSDKFSNTFIEGLKKTKGFAKKSTEEIRKMYKEDSKGFVKLVKSNKEYSKMSKKEIKDALKTTNKDLRKLFADNPKEFKKAVQSISKYSDLSGKSLTKLMRTQKEEFIHQLRNPQIIKDLKKTKEFSGKSTKEILKAYKADSKGFLETIHKIKGYENIKKKDLDHSLKYALASEKTLGKIYDKYNKYQFNIVGVLQAVKRVFGAIEKGIKQSKWLQDFLRIASDGCKTLMLMFNALAGEINGFFGGKRQIDDVIGKKAHILSADKLWRKFRKTLGLTKTEFDSFISLKDGIASVFGLFGEVISQVFKAMAPTKAESKSLRDTIFDLIGAFGEYLSKLVEFIKESGALEFATNTISGIFRTLWGIVLKVGDAFSTMFKVLTKSDAIPRTFKSFGRITKAIAKLLKALGKLGKSIIDAIVDPFNKSEDKTSDFQSTFEGIVDFIADAAEVIATVFETVVGWLTNFINALNDLGIISGTVRVFSTVIGGLAYGIKWLYDVISDFLKGNVFGKFGKDAEKSGKDAEKGMASLLGAFDFKNWKNPFKDFKIGEFLKKAFDDAQKFVLDGIDKLSNLDFNKILEGFKKGFDNVVEFLGETKDKIGEAFKKIEEAANENNFSFETFGKNLKDGISKAIDTIVDLGPKVVGAVASLFNSIFSNISQHLPPPNKLGVAIADFFTDAIKFVFKAIPYLVEIIATAIRTFVANLPGVIVELANGIKNAFKKGLFTPIEIEVNGFKREIPPLFDVLGESFRSIGDKFKDADIDQILGWLNKFLTAGVLNQLRKLLKANRKIPGELGDFLESIAGTAEKAYKPTLADKFAKLAEALLTLAKSIALVAGTLIVLAFIPDDKLIKGGIALAGLAAGLIIFSGGLAAINHFAKGGLADTLNGLGSLMTGLTSLIGILMALTLVNKGMGKSLAILAAILIELGAFVFALKKIAADPGEIQGIAMGLSGLMQSIKQLMFGLVLIAQIDPAKMYNAIIQMGLVMAELGALVLIMSKIPVQNGLKATIQLLPMLLMLGMVVGALYLIKKYELDPSALGWISGVVVALGGVIAVLGSLPVVAGAIAAANLIEFAGILIAAIIAVGAIINALDKITGGGASDLINSALETFGNLMKGLGNAIGQFVAGVGDAITDALPGWADNLSEFFIHLAPGLMVIKSLGKDVGSNISGIASAISSLAGAGLKDAISSFLGGGSGNFEEFGKRFGAFVDALEGVASKLQSKESSLDEKSFAKIRKIANIIKDLSKIEKDLQAQGGLQAGVFGSKDFGKFSSGLKKLFTGFKEIGKTAGEVKNIDKIKQLSSISKALAECMAALPDEKTGMFWLDMAGESKLAAFGKDLVKFGEQMAKYVASVSAIDTSSMSGVVKTITKSIKSLSKVKISGMSSVGKSATKDLTSGFSSKTIASGLNKAISSAVGSVKLTGFTKAGQKAAKAFTDAISNAKGAKAAGESLANSAASGMNTQSGYNAGVNLGAGFVRGANAKGKAAYDAGYNLGEKALSGIRKALQEASPSKKARKSGSYFGEGFVNGIDKWFNRASLAGRNLGLSSIKSLKESVKSSSSILDGMDTTPTIRPVLDLTDVQNGARSINAMFGRNAYALSVAGRIGGSSINSRSPISINNNITVNGSDDPRGWADEFAEELNNELEIQARMG